MAEALQPNVLGNQQQTQPDEAPNWQTYLEITEIDNKGRGYRARCNIPAMTCIMHDTPLISPPYLDNVFSSHKQEHPLEIKAPLILQVLENQEVFDLLSPQTASGRFSREVSPYPSRYSNEMWQLANDKISTNMFKGKSPDSNLFDYKTILKLAVKTSLFNHSCNANVMVHSIRKTIIQKVTTVRDISQGEEVCISYLPDGYLPRDERQRILLERGFECRCERCSTESLYERDIPLTADVNLSPLSDGTIAPLRQRYDQLMRERQIMSGRGNPLLWSAWIMKAEQWLVDASRPPYQLHQFHWLFMQMYKSLRDKYKTMYVNSAGDITEMRKKVLFYGEFIIQAEFAVLQPLDFHKRGVDAFLDDWNDMDMPKNGAWEILNKLDPNAEIIIKWINE